VRIVIVACVKKMDNETILKKAFKKAEKNGYTLPDWWYLSSDGAGGIIFSHSFAKAFWGEGWMLTGEVLGCKKCLKIEKAMRSYRFHLQQMVLKSEPLKYLAKFLE